jgi:hypothetical protein
MVVARELGSSYVLIMAPQLPLEYNTPLMIIFISDLFLSENPRLEIPSSKTGFEKYIGSSLLIIPQSQ